MGNSADGHVEFDDGGQCQSDVATAQEIPDLREPEGEQATLARDPVVEPAFGVDQVVEHPRGGGAADDDNHLRHLGELSVPAMVQCLDQTRFRCSHPRQLVQEYDGALDLLYFDCRGQGFGQSTECLTPGVQPWDWFAAVERVLKHL